MPVYFTDRNLGKRFPEILRAAGMAVERLDDHFAHDTADHVWLKHVGERGWVAITHDARIRYKPNERDAVLAHGVALLVLVGDAPFAELAANFVASRQRIEAFIDAGTPPYIAKIYRPTSKELDANPAASGRIERWFPPPA